MKPLEPETGELTPYPRDIPDPALDRALASLARVDLPPLAASAQLRAARARLHRRGPVTRLERYEPAFLIACGAIHLAWVVWRALALTL